MTRTPEIRAAVGPSGDVVAGAASAQPRVQTRSGNGVKVTVIVPVYNPGPYLHRCVESLLAQSLEPAEYEAVFVDDGSTDESPAALDALAAAHPNMRVIHQPNSGWPGKPRNVGIDAARGRYVYFMDHDDALGAEALERLYAFAERNGSDIVIGKMAGLGRKAPRVLFRETRDRVTLDDSQIMGALSPHKFYNTEFLRRTGIRFPEGRRRMEDLVFVATTYFAADTISILSDYTCYYHLARDDRRNAARGTYDPAGGFEPAYYYRYLREVLDVIEDHTEPGPARDRLLRRFVWRELLMRFSSHRFLAMATTQQRLLLDEVRSVVERYIPGSVDPGLSAHDRTKLALVRANRLDLLVKLAAADQGLHLTPVFRELAPAGSGHIRLRFDVEIGDGRRPLAFEPHEDGLLLPVPREVAEAVPCEARLVPEETGGRVMVALRRHKSGAEITLRSITTQRQVPSDGGVRMIRDVEADIDLDTPAEGRGLRAGRWDVIVRMYLAGYKQLEVALGAPDRLGRSRRVMVLNGRPARGRARWSIESALRRRRLPAVIWRLVAVSRVERLFARDGATD